MIILQTPGTGLDDFETRIALGMCRVALDCVEPDKVLLGEEFDRFFIRIEIDEDKKSILDDALSLWIIRFLSSEETLKQIPGARPKEIYDGVTEYKKTGKKKYRKGHATKLAEFGQKLLKGSFNILELYSPKNLREQRRGAHDSVCGHPIDKILGAILVFSPQLGSPPIRNQPKRGTTPPDVCPFCAAFGLLGLISFQIDLQISSVQRKKKERLFFMPRFRGRTNGEDLLAYIVATKHITLRFEDISADSALLALLSLYPHISRLKMPETFFVAREEYFDNRPSRYQNFMEEEARLELDFLARSSYNVALVQESYRKSGDKPELIRLLSKTLKQRLPRDAISFYREYASVSEGKRLVYRDSTNFIAKEVLEMDECLIDDPNIGAIASMLKFFVRKQKFGYVDNLRVSRTADEFEKHLLSAQKEASSIYAREGGEKEIFLPSETNVREFLRVLQKDGNFEKVKTLVCLFAFTYWKKEVE